MTLIQIIERLSRLGSLTNGEQEVRVYDKDRDDTLGIKEVCFGDTGTVVIYGTYDK
jgi:uncharacterized protein (UPF0218 family)